MTTATHTPVHKSDYPPNTILGIEVLLCPYCEERGEHNVAEWPMWVNGRRISTLAEATCRNCDQIH